MSDENKQVEPKTDAEMSEAELNKTAGGGAIKWTYTQQKRADGSQGGNAAGGWSLVENKVSA